MKRPEPPKDPSAPAYFIQYAALWCIMLAFFVMLLTMGHERSDSYKIGVGYIRDAFGLKGGLGLLPFWRRASAGQGDNNPAPAVTNKNEGDIVANFKGMLWKQGLSSFSILKTEMDDRGISITMGTPLSFAEGGAVLNREARGFLSRIGAVFFNLPDCAITINALNTQGASPDVALLLATERATAISRYLQDVCAIPRHRLDAAGYAHPRYLTALQSPTNQAVLFSIRKVREQPTAPMSGAPEPET